MINNYGKNVFDLTQMRNRLSLEDFEAVQCAIEDRRELSLALADKVAEAMKNWAVEKGATHYCHWFVPLTGATAEKHDSFLSFSGGKAIWEFSGKNLVKGEPDASSFPSGGLRATFEARGYTSWDCASPAFYKDGSLYIPTAFCSYNGEALDKRIPLIRSVDAVNASAVRAFKSAGFSFKRVETFVGAEQEYFLISKEAYKKRPDLICTGRTLLGKRAPKGQELDDHYFGSIKPQVAAFMAELDQRLWELGVPVKTKHNEVAPCQHEIVPIFTLASASLDANHLIMEVMRNVAFKHDFVCLIHEKPFKGINGSGKHNNWSLYADGVNLFKPGKDPLNNLPFLISLASVVRAVNLNSQLLRLSVASSANDNRLGSHEAPPAIVSIYLGDELDGVLCELKTGTHIEKRNRIIKTGTLAPLTLDTSDRNRTSPLAFSGNRFEFRMNGSSSSIADSVTLLNAITAESFNYIADQIEQRGNSTQQIMELIREIITVNERVIFNGDNYTDEWHQEAIRRGLPVITNTVDAVCAFKDERLRKVLSDVGVYTSNEIDSRYEILLENYIRTVSIEARTLADIVSSMIIPAVNKHIKGMGETVKSLEGIGQVKAQYLVDDIVRQVEYATELFGKNAELVKRIDVAKQIENTLERAKYLRDNVLTCMEEIRHFADELEKIVDKSIWPLPSYADILLG